MKTLGEASGTDTTPAVAAVMTGPTAGLLVFVFKGPLWASLLTGAAAALVTKAVIDQSARTA